MVVHEAVGVAYPMVSFIDVGKDSEKSLAVLVVFKDGLFVVPPGGDVIHGAEVFDAQGACPDGRLSKVCTNVKQYRPDPGRLIPLCESSALSDGPKGPDKSPFSLGGVDGKEAS